MIEEKHEGIRFLKRRCWQALFVIMFAGAVLIQAVPGASASALYLLTDGISTVVTNGSGRIEAGRILVTGSGEDAGDIVLEADRKIVIRHGATVLYATSRENESVSELLRRESVNIGELEMVRVDVSGEDIFIEIASNFTYYEIAQESADYTTVYTPDYTLPRGETRVITPGVPGTREVTYEVVYADGEFVSRQAVAEGESNAVPEVVGVGTLVKEAREGDTIDQVIRNEDGSGYLILKSGDSLHFTHTMDVKCTAYTTGYDGVGTITYTGTTVHVGVVAVDKSVIPLGSKMFITTAAGDITYGMGSAEDTGVRGKVVDLFMNTYDECIQFGRRSSILYFLDD
ncbi:MAG: G5 domain-containing protein [Oscillospiraceae bacterium]|nr:G5 domain-containing protein [Oscillospiraceae bacterium]